MMAAKASAIIAAFTVGGTLSGCTTFSFGPPKVEVDKVITNQSPTKCGSFASAGEALIEKNVLGALELTNNFLRSYRCAAHEAADGRQIFEVPSFLALVAGAIGPTFGLGDDGRIAALASASVYGRANNYYAPKEKSAVLDSALDAVVCIKAEAVGISFFDTRANAPDPKLLEAAQSAREATNSAEGALQSVQKEREITQQKSYRLIGQIKAVEAQKQGDVGDKRAELANENIQLQQDIANLRNREQTLAQQAAKLRDQSTRLALLAATSIQEPLSITKEISNGVVKIDVERKYYEMVAASLFSIERVLANRFSIIGAFDSAGITAEIKQLTAEEETADQATSEAENRPIDGTAAAALAPKTFATEKKRNDAVVELTLAALQPRLQQCVVRAKI